MVFKHRWKFVACNKSYGEDCKFPCSPHCINQTCDPFNGTCLTSCEDNAYSDKCIAGNITYPTTTKDIEWWPIDVLCKKSFSWKFAIGVHPSLQRPLETATGIFPALVL